MAGRVTYPFRARASDGRRRAELEGNVEIAHHEMRHVEIGMAAQEAAAEFWREYGMVPTELEIGARGDIWINGEVIQRA